MDPITPIKNKTKKRKFIELPLQQTNKQKFRKVPSLIITSFPFPSCSLLCQQFHALCLYTFSSRCLLSSRCPISVEG